MLFALIYYFALYSGVAAQVARSNTVARHFTQTPRCGNIEVLLRPHSRFHQFRGKERKRGACVRRACDRVSGSRNASGGRVQSMIVCVYTSAVPRMRRVVRNGCLRRTAPQALRGGSLCGFPRNGVLSYFCRAADWARRGLVFTAIVVSVHAFRRTLHTASAPIADVLTLRTPNGAYVKYF